MKSSSNYEIGSRLKTRSGIFITIIGVLSDDNYPYLAVTDKGILQKYTEDGKFVKGGNHALDIVF